MKRKKHKFIDGIECKYCSKCKNWLPLKEFGIDNRQWDKLKKYCKKCRLDYRRTKEGLIARIFNDQHKTKYQIHYTLEELREWAMSQEIFHILYDKWVKSNYQKDLTPSFDRINAWKDYSLDNLQIITWKENYEKGRKETAEKQKIMFRNRKDMSKKVIQYDKQGNFINIFPSIHEAGRQTGVDYKSISKFERNKG